MGFLKTRWTDSIDRNNPLPEYPRPQMERENWMSMNGVYDYAMLINRLNGLTAMMVKLLFLMLLNVCFQVLKSL